MCERVVSEGVMCVCVSKLCVCERVVSEGVMCVRVSCVEGEGGRQEEAGGGRRRQEEAGGGRRRSGQERTTKNIRVQIRGEELCRGFW